METNENEAKGVTEKSRTVSPVFRQGVHFPTGDEEGNVSHAQRQIVYTRKRPGEVRIDTKHTTL